MRSGWSQTALHLVRPAVTADVPRIRELVNEFTGDRRLLGKATVTLYEDIQEFVVVEQQDAVIGCGALHVMWQDLAEVRTIAVDPQWHGQGLGSAIVSELLRRARILGIQRVFCLTFAERFFAQHGFAAIHGTPVDQMVFAELLQSEDEGVAEFLDLERVKPNTLGNQRMLLRL